MVRIANLKKGSFESAKISVKKGKLYSEETIKSFVNQSFDEILKYMEEHGFKKSIDSSYLQFEGFYLIERVLNMHTSRIYKHVFSSASKQNKNLLEVYYLKYQIHNLMVLVRCYLSKEKDIEPFLIGDERRKEKYVKAFEMPKLEDAITYISKKLRLDESEVLKAYENGVYELENYLYKQYYEKLKSYRFKYNSVDESKFFKFIRTYIDLINARTFMKLKSEELKSLNFNEMYIEGGELNLKFFNDISNLDVEKSLDKFNKHFGHLESCKDLSCIASLDKRVNEHKASAKEVFKIASFGSPFFSLKYLLEVERQMAKLRVLLKAKYLKVEDKEIEGLLM